VICDLADMPHLLIAGATGSGKSVCINTIISCLIMEQSPENMRLIMIDPKRVELTPYNGIPHLLTPVVVDPVEVVDLLKSLINEMLERYKRMEAIGARNIETYNQKAKDCMPYIVITVDELADLMMTSSFDVEKSLCRLAQLGRATGIHLIVATQRPSVDVLTGLIKANFPSRISFGVASQIDSRTILDVTGAEKLLGKGDMLYLGADNPRPVRVQGVYISDKEVEALVKYWVTCPKGEIGQVILRLPEEERGSGNKIGSEDSHRDSMMDKAIELAQLNTKLSTSLLQRKLRIGYPRAARLMDDLEENGFVAQSDGSKSRDVII
jgi:S-DNA-T family DNA segregation ATPase FtsK/SpoIIIE